MSDELHWEGQTRPQDGPVRLDKVGERRMRVLVLRPENPPSEHQQVLAICLEQNFVGCGRTPAKALSDLCAVMGSMLLEYLNDTSALPDPDPDPSLSEAFDNPAVKKTAEGDRIIRRNLLKAEYGLVHRVGSLEPTFEPHFTLQECLA